MHLDMGQQGLSAADGPADPEPSVFSALREQLGLKLESTEEPSRNPCDRPYRAALAELALASLFGTPY